MWWVALVVLVVADAPAAPPAADPNGIIVRDYTLSAVVQAGACTITIHPRAPWALKATTPLEAVLQSADVLSLAKASLSEKDYVDPKAADKTLVVQPTAPAPPSASVKAALNFFLCTADVCQRYRDTAECKFPSVAQLP